MDPDPLASLTTRPPRKVKFAPKAPPKREAEPLVPKVEKTEEVSDDVAIAEHLLRRLNETSLRGRPKVEKKAAPARVAFGCVGSSAPLRSYSNKNAVKRENSSANVDDEQRVEKDYREPWDYYSNYPTVLPLRRPYSGNPEILDKKEFGDGVESAVYDENTMNPAKELGLLDDNPENNIFFIQLPKALPLPTETSETQDKKTRTSQKPCNFESLPSGFMGKMLVYRSGAVKLKLGDTLYDVSPGVNSEFSQNVFAMNTNKGDGCNTREINKRAVVTPDVDSILDSILDS